MKAQYLLTDLPQYVHVTDRSQFANSIVKEGAVLVFSEDGKTLTGKLPDSTFTSFCSGGGAVSEYYRCASVTPGTAVPEGATFTMALKLIAFNSILTYSWTMDDTSKTGTERTWSGIVDGDSSQTSVLKINDTGFWQITDGLGETTAQVISNNPWEITNWDNPDGGAVSCTYSNISAAVSSTDTWSGYKAVFDSETATWDFESTLTEGLTYTVVTPKTGQIYSADVLVHVASLRTSGILNDDTVSFLLCPAMSSSAIVDIAAAGNNVSVTNVDDVYVGNNKMVFGDNKYLIIPANTLPTDIFVSGSPFLIQAQCNIPDYTDLDCCLFARTQGSVSSARLDLYVDTKQNSNTFGRTHIGYWTNNIDTPAGGFTLGTEHVIAFQYDGSSTSRVYLDGKMQYAFTGTGYMPFRTLDFLIGCDADVLVNISNANPWQGTITYFRVRNVAPYQGSSYYPEYL